MSASVYDSNELPSVPSPKAKSDATGLATVLAQVAGKQQVMNFGNGKPEALLRISTPGQSTVVRKRPVLLLLLWHF